MGVCVLKSCLSSMTNRIAREPQDDIVEFQAVCGAVVGHVSDAGTLGCTCLAHLRKILSGYSCGLMLPCNSYGPLLEDFFWTVAWDTAAL